MAITTVLSFLMLVLLVTGVAVTTYHYAQESLVHPIVLLNGVFSYFIVIPGVYLGMTRNFSVEFPFAFETPEWIFVQTLAICLAMYLSIVVVFERVPVRKTAVQRKAPRWQADSGLVLTLGVFGFVVGLLSFGYYVFVNGGPVRLLTVIPRTAFQTVPETARYRIFGLMGIFGGVFTAFTAARPAVEARSLSRSRITLLFSMA